MYVHELWGRCEHCWSNFPFGDNYCNITFQLAKKNNVSNWHFMVTVVLFASSNSV